MWKSKKLRQQRLKERFGRNPLKDYEADWVRGRMDEIRIYHKELSGQNEENMIDAVTWDDLEMDEVFLRLNNTKCFIGEQVLCHKLHDIGSNEDWSRMENEVEYVTHNEDARIAIEERLGCIGKREDDYHLPTFLMHSELWKIKSGIGIHLLQIILILFLMGSIFWTMDYG